MYEDKNYKNILNDGLNQVSNNVDKRQGSIIYDAIAPASFLISNFYQELRWTLENVIFLDTAIGGYLDKIGFMFAVDRKMSTFAQRNVVFVGATINNGERFYSKDNLYWVYKKNKNVVECEQKGTTGNLTPIGSNLVPVNDIRGLQSATLEDITIPAIDTEDDETYRQRIIQKLREPPINSNLAHIKQWCLEVEGVGGVRVFPIWNGANTVKAVIVDSEKNPASDIIIQKVQDYIEPFEAGAPANKRGMGNGKADIGCIFTAIKANSIPINLSFKITQLASGKTTDDAKNEVLESLKQYLKSIAFKDENIKDIVRYQEIATLILNTPSIIDFTELNLNGAIKNIEIDLEGVAVSGNITLIS